MNTKTSKRHLLLASSLMSVIASVPAHAEAVTDIAAGQNHTCILESNGEAYCWGANAVGQLGNGTTKSSMVPVAVSGDLEFRSISAGWDHTCGVTVDNDAYCWGRGRYGRLGNGSSENSLTPKAVSGDLSFESVNPGLAHTCGITTDGDAFCWGRGEDGILGNEAIKSSPVPVPVSGGLAFGSIDAGSATTCGIATNGHAYCWGASDFGSLLGLGEDRSGKTAPAAVSGNFSFRPDSISVGLDHVCAISTTNKAVCWGRGRFGKLGIGSADSLGVIENLSTPREAKGDISFALIATGVFQTCGIATDGKAYCWGRNGSGQLGDGTTTMQVEPVAVSANFQFKDIAVGNDHACGISANDEVYCWGDGAEGKLGTRSLDNKLVPTKVRLK